MSVRHLIAAIVVISFVAGGCTSVWVQERRLAPTGLAPKDALAVVLTLPLNYKQLPELEQAVTGCVRDSLGSTYPDLRIVPPEEFRKAVFPELDKENLPVGGFSWQSFFQEPALRNRIAQLGLRYLIAVDIEERSRLTGAEWGAATKVLGGPGPVVQESWENSALLQAVVVDTRYQRLAGSVQAYASGKGEAGLTFITFPMVLPIPYGTTSFPLGAACRGLGERLAQFLAAESPAEEQTPKKPQD